MTPIESLKLRVCGFDNKLRVISYNMWSDLPRVTLPAFGEDTDAPDGDVWEGVRLADFLDRIGLDEWPEDQGLSVYSSDPSYVEGFSLEEVRDERTVLVTAVNGQPLDIDSGGPLRLMMPGAKSVKWVGAIRAVRY